MAVGAGAGWRAAPGARWVVALLLGVVCWRAALALGGADFERTYNGFDTHSDGLLIGALLALAPPGPALRRWAGRWAAVPLGFLAAVLLAVSYKSVTVQAVGMVACARGGGLAAGGGAGAGPVVARAVDRAAALHGRISYSLYLWHLPILLLGARHVPHGWVGTVILLVVCLVAAAASYHLIERPFIGLRIASRIRAGRSRSARRQGGRRAVRDRNVAVWCRALLEGAAPTLHQRPGQLGSAGAQPAAWWQADGLEHHAGAALDVPPFVEAHRLGHVAGGAAGVVVAQPSGSLPQWNA